MKCKFFKIICFVLLVLFAALNSYFFTHLYSYDEIWNYGFAANIVDGLVPYKDFNMVVGPVFPYLLSIILSIFGKKLIVYHVVIALMVTAITFMAAKKIKFYSILIYVALLIYSINGYNTSTLLLLLILLTLLDKDDAKYNDIVIPIIIGIMALTKQTLAVLIIPSFIYSKNRKKTFAVYLVMFLGFCSYLLINNNLLEFLDYCVFGLFDFAGNNGLIIPLYLFLEIIIVIILLIALIRSKFMRKDIFYVLLYQVMALPILEVYHFVLGWSAFLYIIFKSNIITKSLKNYLFIFLVIMELLVLFTTNTLYTIKDRIYYEHYSGKTFLEGRLCPQITEGYIEDMESYINKYSDYKLYIFGGYSYLVKLSLDIPINKFDLINNGNMGYNGASRYLQEIKETCAVDKCLFIINDSDLKTQLYNQTNKEILKYVVNNNTKIYASSVFGVYINQNGGM